MNIDIDILHDTEILLDEIVRQVQLVRVLIDPDIPDHIKLLIQQYGLEVLAQYENGG